MQGNWKTEFPDFDGMPELPKGLRDASWHNDACPKFIIWEDDESPKFQWITLWVDWANPDHREVSTSCRYLITATDEDGRVDPVTLAQSDDWEVIRQAVEFLQSNGGNMAGDVIRLSRYFSALIRAEYSESELVEVNARNRKNPDQGCATHDFRDANAYMYGAFCALFFTEPDAGEELDSALMNAAWDLSRATGFAG